MDASLVWAPEPVQALLKAHDNLELSTLLRNEFPGSDLCWRDGYILQHTFWRINHVTIECNWLEITQAVLTIYFIAVVTSQSYLLFAVVDALEGLARDQFESHAMS